MTEKQTVTTRELAEMLGLSRIDIANAKHYRNSAHKDGSKISAVDKGLRDLGLMWEQVVYSPRGGLRVKKPADKKAPEPVTAPAPKGIPRPLRSMPLDDLIAEIQRRFPRAEIIFQGEN